MRKKCVPGTLCIENMTFMLVIILGIMVVYLYYVYFIKNAVVNSEFSNTNMLRLSNSQGFAESVGRSQSAIFRRDEVSYENANIRQSNATAIMVPISSSSQVSLSDPYNPPLKTDIPVPVRVSVPINVRTNSADLPYTQVGILTKNDKGTMILPLMGRGLWNGRDKWQYYTMSNTAGALNTKLPISVNGRSCTGEYGCDSISNGDTVYVEGYNDTFRATIYENSVLRYLPI